MAVSMTPQADHSLAAALLVVITAIALSNVNGVLAEAIFAVMALAAMSAAKAKRLSNAALASLYALAAIAIFGTAIKMEDGVDVSTRQIFRTSVWVLFYCFLLVAGRNVLTNLSESTLNTLYATTRKVVIMVAILVAIDLVSGTELSPAVIRVKDAVPSDQRIYIMASSALPALLLLFLWRVDVAPCIATLVLIGASQGKTMLAAIPIALVVLAIAKPRQGVLALLIVAPLAVMLAPTDRLVTFVDGGDFQRLRQINEALEAYTADGLSMTFGIGHGTPYSAGYAQFGAANPEQANLYENSRFDVENGYIYLLLRFGFLGLFIFVILTLKAITNRSARLAFILNTIVICSASSFFATPGGIFFICAFLFTSALLTKLPSPQRP
jgi:hypothetical protein